MKSRIQVWIDANWPRLVGAGRWLRAPGPNWVPNSQWDTRPYRILIARLSPWQDVLLSSTHRLLYAVLRSRKQLFPDLAFVPPLRDTVQMKADGIPWWFGLGTRRPATDFDCIAISNALVQESVNLAPTLRASGIALRKSERMADARTPLVILGGANSMHSSLLWTADPLVDGIFIGEEPEWIVKIFESCAEAKAKGMDKEAILAKLCKDVPGFFEPEALVSQELPLISKAHASIPSVNQFKPFEPMVPGEEVAAVSSLHISEGCPSFCSFCAESYARKPYREVPGDLAIKQAMEMKAALGLEEIELFSFNFNNHTDVHRLIPELARRFDRVGLKSQRFDALAADPELVGLMRQVGKNSITCGLEGISDRMRSYLQKGLSTQQLQEALVAMMREPLRELKVFLIASGLEETQDFEEFAQFLRWFKTLYDRTSRRPRVTFSATPLVRFPWTPLEYEDGISAEDCGRRVRQIKDCVVRAGFDFREAASEWEAEISQILIRAKDPRILDALIEAQEITGELYAETLDEVLAQAFRKALAARGLDPMECLKGHLYATPVPWQRIDPGISRKYLERMHSESRKFHQTPICLGDVNLPGKCSACDACTPTERKNITQARKSVVPAVRLLEQDLKAIRQQEKSVYLHIKLDSNCQGWPYKTLSAWLLQAVIAVSPEFLSGFRRHGKCDWQTKLDDDTCLVTGEVRFEWIVLEQSLPVLASLSKDPNRIASLRQKLQGWMEWIDLSEQIVPNAQRLELILDRGDFSPEDWLRSKGLKFTLIRKESEMHFELSKDSIKKKILSNLSTSTQGNLKVLSFVPLEKLDLRDFLKNVANRQELEGWRRTVLRNFYTSL